LVEINDCAGHEVLTEVSDNSVLIVGDSTGYFRQALQALPNPPLKHHYHYISQ
jgi:hypothetical protein